MHIENPYNHGEYELCCWCFSRNFPKLFRTAILKENLPINVSYFIKEQPWMSASDEVTLRKYFGGSKPSSKLTLKTKWYHSCGCSDDSQSCEKLKMCYRYVFWKKVRLWTLITFCYRKCMLPLQYFNDWCLNGVYVWQKFWRKNISNWMIIWIKFKVLWLS